MTRTGPNPYVGPRSFQIDETLYARDRELRQLTDRLLAERIVLLHSPSGAGKTSLMQAGLIPALREEAFHVHPVIRVHLERPLELLGKSDTLGDPRRFDRYTFSTLLSLEEAFPDESRVDLPRLARFTLDDYLTFRAKDAGREGPEFLAFDQFEEILTINPADRPGKDAFFAQLGTALKNRDRWALFAMREDYVAALEPYVRAVPTYFANTFRLDLLGAKAAREAIQEPARGAGVDFPDDAANRLVDDLRRSQVQNLDGTIESTLGPYVEPVQLQVVCYRLWETGSDADLRIDLKDLAAVGDVDQSLADYYASSVARVAAEASVSERGIREWFENRLITKDGIRRQVLMGAGASEDLDNSAVHLLEDAHIIRSEKRAGATWYELAHDRLIDPVRKNNVAWFEANLKLFQRQAVLWDEQGRGEGLLLRGETLETAEAEARSGSLTAEENAFLEACRALRQRERRDTYQRRMIAVALVVSLVLLVAAGFFGVSANRATQRAEQQAAISRAGELAAQAVTARDQNLLLSLLLSVEAHQRKDTVQSRSALLGNAQTSPQLRVFLSGHSEEVTSVAFSPDGETLASGSGDDTIILWDLATGQPIGGPLEGHSGLVSSVAFSPDGGTLASGSWDSTIILWDVATGQPIGGPLEGHSGYVYGVAFSPDGGTLASGSGDDTIILWDVATGQPIGGPLKGHSDDVSSVAFSPDGGTLASGSGDDTIILWDVATGQPIGGPLEGHSDDVSSVAFSPDGGTLASGSWDNTVILWDVATGQPIGGPLEGHSGYVYGVAFSPDGGTLASGSGSGDNTVILWDLATGQPIGGPLNGHSDDVSSVAFSPDGGTLASGSWDDTIILWDLATDQPIGGPLEGHSGLVSSVAFSPDGETLASGSGDDAIILWDLATGQPIGGPLEGHSDDVSSVAFSPDGGTLASGSGDDTIILWDVATGQPIGGPLKGHSDDVSSVAFSPDGETLASGSGDDTIILWDLATGQPIGGPLKGHSGLVSSVAFSPDGGTLASGSWDSTIILWDLATGQPIGGPLKGHSGYVYGVAFSPDGGTLASGSGDDTIILWDVATGQPIGGPLKGHSDDVSSVAFSPDGGTLASGSGDDTIILWDLATGQPIGGPLEGHSDDVSSVAFSPDGGTLASGSWDNTVILWDLAPSAWAAANCRRAGRNFTPAEWDQYFPGEPYRATCPQWSLEP